MRKAINSTAVALTRRYLSRPEEFWKDAPERQVRKLKAMLRGARKEGERDADVILEALAIARLRSTYGAPHVYLSNIGSSGSHWLEAMLARATDVHSCGEVYFPKGLREELARMPAADVDYFLHAVYALHTDKLGPRLVTGSMINSAHYSRVSSVAGWTPGARTILLVRNPVDIVISRTIRKEEYRNEVAPGMDDRAYLERNCDMVRRFYEEASREPFDAVVRYEDLVAEPERTLADLIGKLGWQVDPAAISSAVEATSKKAVQSAAERGEKAPTNLFLGDAAAPDDLTRKARKNLKACCAQLGYAT